MKNKLINITILLFVLTFLPSIAYGPGKCKGDSEYQQAVKKMGGFRLIKDYRVSLSAEKEKGPTSMAFPVSLTSGLRYKFILINNPSNKSKMIMSIFINENKEMLIASSYQSTTNKHYPSIEFECGNSGTYYLFFSFEKAFKGCGVGVFSVSK